MYPTFLYGTKQVRNLRNISTRCWPRRRPCLWRNRDGATAVEFALIAFPFFGLVMGCIELAIVLVAGVSLDLATAKVSREIRTGLVSKPVSANEFIAKTCAEMAWLGSDCTVKLRVDVRTFDSFKLVNQAPEIIVNGQFQNTSYQAGDGTKIQLVRAYYPWKVFSPFLQPGFTALSRGEMVITSSVVFRNEPF